jgi:hypothetical protein
MSTDNGFEFTVPIWTLVHEASLWDQGLPAAILHLTEGHTGPPTWPLFTMPELAKRFADAAPVTANVVPMPIGGIPTVCGILTDLIAMGFEEVVIDAPYGPGTPLARFGAKQLLAYLQADE